MRRAFLLLWLLVACVHSDRPVPTPDAVEARPVSDLGPDAAAWEPIRVSVRVAPLAPSAPDMAGVGALIFRGGLELASDDRRFGGLSGLWVGDDGRLVAVTDQGSWFAAQLVFGEAGDLTGLADGRIAAMRGPDGQPFAERRDTDAEDITRLPDGRFAVSFEQVHRVRIYDLAGKGAGAAPDATLELGGVEALTGNDSLEAMSAFGDRLLIGAEGNDRGGAPFWITSVAPESPPAPAGRSVLTQGYGLVALDRLPDGDFLAMERFFAPLIGPRIVIARIAAAGLEQTPARWERTVVADVNPPVALDNFEGLAIVAGDAATRVYIVSDDNFSRDQRTLIYAFDLAGR